MSKISRPSSYWHRTTISSEVFAGSTVSVDDDGLVHVVFRLLVPDGTKAGSTTAAEQPILAEFTASIPQAIAMGEALIMGAARRVFRRDDDWQHDRVVDQMEQIVDTLIGCAWRLLMVGREDSLARWVNRADSDLSALLSNLPRLTAVMADALEADARAAEEE